MSILISSSWHCARIGVGQQTRSEACPQKKSSRKTRACAEPEDKRQIFQVAPSRSNTTYEDARLAMECCDCLEDKNRADCYASFGCDVERVDKYLGAVLRLEDMYAAPLKGEEVGPATFSVTTPFGVTHLPVPPQLPTPPTISLPANIRLPSMPHHGPTITLPDADEVLLGLLDAANSTSQQMARFREAWEQVRHEFEDAAHLMFDEAHLEQAPPKAQSPEKDSEMDWGRSPPRSR